MDLPTLLLWSEGHGEANAPSSGGNPAIIILIARLLSDLGCATLFPTERVPPFRMPYGDFFKNKKLERAIRYHAKFDDCAGILILLDMDDDCPTTKAKELTKRIMDIQPLPFSVAVVCAKREFESWFLASLETIQKGRTYDNDPELKRDAKGWLRKEFG